MNAISAAPATAAPPMKRKIAAILAADVAGYSRLVAEDEERTLTDLAAAREIFDALVARSGGRIFNTAGDSVMCEFDSALEAIRTAIDIQDGLRSRNQGVDKARRLEFRMGLTIGDVVERGGDLLGDGVNIAARLEGLAPPGGICVSRSLHEAVANKLTATFRELGPRSMKNMPQPVHAYLVSSPSERLSAVGPSAGRGRDGGPEDGADGRSRVSASRLALLGGLLIAVLAGAVPALNLVRPVFQAEAPVGPTPAGRPDSPAKPPQNEAAGPAQQTSPVPNRPARQADRSQPGPARSTGKDGLPRVEPAKPDGTARPDAPAKPETARTLPADPAAAFSALAREGLLADARTLPELYHNARYLEGKGDRPAALTAYAAAAPLAGEAIDVHLRYASLMRAVRGAAAVKQVYAALARSAPSGAVGLVTALSGEAEERRAKLEAFANADPGGSAADYVLSEALTEGRDGGPTLTDRRLAFDAVDRFLEAASSKALDDRFVDRGFLDSWVETARRRRDEIESFFAAAATRPSGSYSRLPNGWLARVILPEPATAVSVRIGERGDFAPATLARATDAKTGKASTVGELELPASIGRVTLYVTYRDRSGRDAGPFPLPFDPGATTVETGRAVLERYPDSWVAFRSDIPDVLSFAGLVSNRCAITRATIGFGEDPPRDAIPLPPCDQTGPAALPSGSSILRLPDGVDSVQVQLTYTDGSESRVRTFRRP